MTSFGTSSTGQFIHLTEGAADFSGRALPRHLAGMPGGPWAIWRWICLRGAGFPADLPQQLAASDVAAKNPKNCEPLSGLPLLPWMYCTYCKDPAELGYLGE
jgi:hypothetical protein